MNSASELRPLEGVRVLDLSRAVSGPFATRILSDLGADVLKVESPQRDVTEFFGRVQAAHSGLYAQMNAGKRTIRLDLRSAEDAARIKQLAAQADIVVENFRPGILAKAGLGFTELESHNPRIILLSISGYGQEGPEANRRAYAPTIHAESGMLVRQGRLWQREPADFGFAFADTLSSLHGVIAVLAALVHRDAVARAQHIDLSMIDAVVASDDQVHQTIERSAATTASQGLSYRTVGGPILLAASPRHAWTSLVSAFGLVDDGDPEATVADKIARRHVIIQEWLLTFDDREKVHHALAEAGLACADLRAPEEVLDSPTFRHRPPLAWVGDGADGERPVVMMPYRTNVWNSRIAGPVPPRDSSTDDVIAAWLGSAQS